MKIVALLASALLPLGILAAPAGGENYVVDPREGGLKHAEVACEIVNVSTSARCRAGPDTKYEVVAEIKKGTVGGFTCVKRGECITDDDFTNCGWHHMNYGGKSCYISGHYTDGACTLDNLGWCYW